MRLQVPESRLPTLEKQIVCLQPWMHPYQFSEQVFTGRYKYHYINETCCLSSSPPELIERIRSAFDDYMQGHPYFFIDRVLELLGPDVRSSSFLDIACATGRFSFYPALEGAGQVLGIEIRKSQIEQCELIRETDTRLRDLRITFQHVPTSADDESFLEGHCYDVVLCMGLLYHLKNPLQHLRNLYRLTNRIAIVRTLTHSLPMGVGYWRMVAENPTVITKATEGISWIPHYKDVPGLLKKAGFKRVEVLVHPLLESIQNPLLSPPSEPPAHGAGIWLLRAKRVMDRLLPKSEANLHGSGCPGRSFGPDSGGRRTYTLLP